MSLFVTLPAVSMLLGIFHIGKFCFLVQFFLKLLLRNCAVDFVEICKVCARRMIIKAAKRIINSDKICRSYSDLNFGVTFFGTQCILSIHYIIIVNMAKSMCFVASLTFTHKRLILLNIGYYSTSYSTLTII